MKTAINLNPHISYFLDENKSYDIEAISALSSGYFIPLSTDGLRLPKTEGQLWLKLTCESTLAQREKFVIDFIDPSLYVIELYSPAEDGFTKALSGTSITQNKKSIAGNRNNLLIEIEPDTITTLYIKIYSTNNMTISAEIMDDEIATERNINERTFLGLFYGALVVLMIYNLLLFIATRFRVFIICGLYTFLVALFTGSADGFTAQYFHFLVDWTNGYHDVFIAASSNIVGMLFLRDYLRVSEWSAGYDNGIKWFIYGILVSLALVGIFYNEATFVYLSYVAILVLTVTLFMGILAVKRNRPQAVYFLVAYVVFGGFILLFILSLFRVMPYGILVKYAIHFGYVSCISILSYGLSVKVYALYRQLLQKETDQKNLIQRKNQELEEKVAERTQSIQEKEINLRSILDNYDNSIWSLNSRFEIIEFNTVFSYEWKLAYDIEVEVGRNILDLIPDTETRTLWKNRYENALDNKKAVYHDSYQVGSEKKHYEIHVFPISYENEVTGISFFSKDITKRVIAQEQLLSQNQILTKVNKELDSFVYSASHDLKAPLASVLGLISLLRKEKDQNSAGLYYDMMEKSIKRLDRFIKDIIDYSRNARVDLEPEEIHLKQLINNSFDDLKYIDGAEEIKKYIHIKDDLKVTTDPTRLRVVVRNILSNAIKYGHEEGGRKQIEVEAYRENGKLVMSITDSGPGIPEDQQEKIFDMFYRLHENKSGTGLGLYIVQETIDKLKGTIKVVKKEGKGACFQITIPLVKQPKHSEPISN
ncbi:MAG: 7TM diverse intracellular signaling domain-containing protein [Bacteroidota bacterium]